MSGNLTRRTAKGANTTMDDGALIVAPVGGVRRLTPVECSRLMGWPDTHLDLYDEPEDQAIARAALRFVWVAARAATLRDTLGGLGRFHAPEVLFPGVYGGFVSWAVAAEYASERRKLPGENAWTEAAVRGLWFLAESGSSPRRRESFEQLAGELGRPLSSLPLDETSAAAWLQRSGLLADASAERLLRHARCSVEAVGRSAGDEAESTRRRRPRRSADETRLTSTDARRYSACGDGVVAPVVEWIARRMIACAVSTKGEA